MSPTLVNLVRIRAGFRCEYCHTPMSDFQQGFEIDHIIALKHHGATIAENLALACFGCNNQKGTNVAGIDIPTRKLTRLFHPRRHPWRRHFRWRGVTLIGLTRIGRTTVDVLEINNPLRVSHRKMLRREGRFPFND